MGARSCEDSIVLSSDIDIGVLPSSPLTLWGLRVATVRQED